MIIINRLKPFRTPLRRIQSTRTQTNQIITDQSPASVMFTLPHLVYQQRYSFVNIMIDSKYYHEQLPRKVEDILNLIEE